MPNNTLNPTFDIVDLGPEEDPYRVAAVCDCTEDHPVVAIWIGEQGWSDPEDPDRIVGIDGHPDDLSAEMQTVVVVHRGLVPCPACWRLARLPPWSAAEEKEDELLALAANKR